VPPHTDAQGNTVAGREQQTAIDLVNKEASDYVNMDNGKLPHWDHMCDRECCAGNISVWLQGVADSMPLGPQTDLELDMIVIDGCQQLNIHCCAFYECPNPPAATSDRFCREHKALERECAYCIGEDAQGRRVYCSNEVSVGSQWCSEHAQAEQEFGQRLAFRRLPERVAGK